MRDPAAAAAVDAHYGRSGPMRLLGAAIHDAVGTDGPIDPEALEPYEEFHVGARPATLRLAELARPGEGMRVLDVGAGVGGPARLLARRFGCRVTALDLTEEFCRLAEELTARTGLSEAVAVVQGDALDMPFPDAAFDLVWTQHASMNIADRERLYAGMRRVCAPDGRLALYDVLAGPDGAADLPAAVGGRSVDQLAADRRASSGRSSRRPASGSWSGRTRPRRASTVSGACSSRGPARRRPACGRSSRS